MSFIVSTTRRAYATPQHLIFKKMVTGNELDYVTTTNGGFFFMIQFPSLIPGINNDWVRPLLGLTKRNEITKWKKKKKKRIQESEEGVSRKGQYDEQISGAIARSG